jgi:hypothetical protein
MAIAAIAIAPQAIDAIAIAAIEVAPQAIDAITIDEATTVPQAIDEMAIAAIGTCAVTPTDAKNTRDSPKVSCRTPIRSIWIAKTKGCSMTNQKSPTILREAIGTETHRSLRPQEKEGPSDAVAATRIHKKTLKEPPRNVPWILSTSSTTPMIRIALRILPKVAQNTAKCLLGQKRSVRSSNRTLLTIRSTPRVAEHVTVGPTNRNLFPLPMGGQKVLNISMRRSRFTDYLLRRIVCYRDHLGT